MARAWLERNKEIFIQQAFLEYLLCIKHRGYHSELERPGLHPLEGRSRGQPASLIMGFGVLRGMCPDPVSPPCRGKCKPQVSTLEPQTHLGSHLIHPPTPPPPFFFLPSCAAHLLTALLHHWSPVSITGCWERQGACWVCLSGSWPAPRARSTRWERVSITRRLHVASCTHTPLPA